MTAPCTLRRAASCSSLGGLFAWAYAPRLARAEGRDPRFLTIVLRGALDGLAQSLRSAIQTGSVARRQCAAA